MKSRPRPPSETRHKLKTEGSVNGDPFALTSEKPRHSGTDRYRGRTGEEKSAALSRQTDFENQQVTLQFFDPVQYDARDQWPGVKRKWTGS